MEDPISANSRAWENTPGDTFYPLPERPEFLRHVPILGRWQPPYSLPPNSAAAHFMMSVINNRNFIALEDHGLKLRHGQKCSIMLDQVIAGGQHVIVKLLLEDGVVLVGYNLCNDNGVGGPYMLMENGVRRIIGSIHRTLRRYYTCRSKRILHQMSYYISQLSKLRFNSIGRLRFGESPHCPHLVPIEESNDPEPYDGAARYFTQELAQCVPPSGQNDYLQFLRKSSGSW